MFKSRSPHIPGAVLEPVGFRAPSRRAGDGAVPIVNYRPASNAVEPGVLVAEPEDVAVVGDHPLQAAPMMGLVHLAQG